MDFQTLSDDFNALMDGYFEYADEVVTNRAIPDAVSYTHLRAHET